MSKQIKQNSIINPNKTSSKSINKLHIETKIISFLGNKTNRGKENNTPNSISIKYKSKSTEHKTLKSKESEIRCNIYKNDEKENKKIKVEKNTFDLYDQIGKELNNNYLNQNIILMTDYMKTIIEFSSSKRIILLDWIMEICCFAHFKRETFHMKVSLIDICFSKLKNISVYEFQLLGIKCLFISSKYLEVSIPGLKKYTEFTGDTYSVQEIKDYEKKILGLLKWKLNFLDIFQWSNLILYKWNIFINEYSPLFKMNENDINKLYLIYYFIIDSIVLDYYYRFNNMKYICISIIYLIYGYFFEYISETSFDLSKFKYYDKF